MARVNRVLGYRPLRKRTPRESMGTRWARFVTLRPLPAMLVSLAVLGAVALPALHMELGLPDGGSKPTSSTERRAYDLLTEGFGPGFNGTLTVVVDAPNLSAQDRRTSPTSSSTASRRSPAWRPSRPPAERGRRPHDRAGHPGHESRVRRDQGPREAAARKADDIREKTGIQAYVTGTTAMNIDAADTLAAALPRYIAVVVGLALILLMIVFRSILVPLKAAGGFLLSIAAAMGVVVWIFQDGNLADLFGVSNPARSSASCRSCSSGSCSAWRWTTRCSSSRGCARPSSTAPSRATRS